MFDTPDRLPAQLSQLLNLKLLRIEPGRLEPLSRPSRPSKTPSTPIATLQYHYTTLATPDSGLPRPDEALPATTDTERSAEDLC